MSYTDMETTPAPEDVQKEQSKKISFRFCRECSNMLYPKEDEVNRILMFTCRNCNSSEVADTARIYRNALKDEIAETAGNVEDVAQDPTVGIRDHVHDVDAYMPDDGDEGEEEDPYDSAMDIEIEGEESVPSFCTLCGNEILCPNCGNPSDQGLTLETTDPGASENPQEEKERAELERRERALSGAGLNTT